MGVFYQPITLIGPSGVRETVEAMVDTGAMFTVIPAYGRAEACPQGSVLNVS
jgi:hypothetical protein